MIHRYISKADEAKKTKIELTREYSHYTTTIKYPEPDPRDRINDEYDDSDDDQSG